MQFPIFKQEDFSQELGVGEGYSISRYGCALCCVTAVCNWYGRSVAPDHLNIELVNVDGFQSNGTTNQDGSINKTLLVWGKIAQIYGEILLTQNVAFPTTPADMQMIDAYLAHNQPVIVGVSFLHNSNDKLPTHYVVIFAKNADGTYQCMDPWFGDEIIFDTRYAVNGMSVANAILQVVVYTGPIQQVAPTNAPEAAHTQIAATPADNFSQQAQNNWNLYLQEVDLNKQKDDRIGQLEQQVRELTNATTKLTSEIADTKSLNSTLATHLANLEKEDSVAVTEGIKAQEELQNQKAIVNSVSQHLKSKPTLRNILQELDTLFQKVNWAHRVTDPKQAPVAAAHSTPPYEQASVMSILGIDQKEVNTI